MRRPSGPARFVWSKVELSGAKAGCAQTIRVQPRCPGLRLRENSIHVGDRILRKVLARLGKHFTYRTTRDAAVCLEMMMSSSGDTVAAVKAAIYKSAVYLDDQKWADWLALCDEEFAYSIKAFSPEISYDMTYLSGKRKDLLSMTEMLPKHNTDQSPLTRHTVVYTVDVDEKSNTASAISSVAVYQTMLDGVNSHVDAGESHLFLIGKYHDTFKLVGDDVKFLERVVRLDTRRLDKGSHWPI